MLDANIKQQLKTYLQMLRHPIELVASLDNSSIPTGHIGSHIPRM